jgi:uncharacterized protein YlaI
MIVDKDGFVKSFSCNRCNQEYSIDELSTINVGNEYIKTYVCPDCINEIVDVIDNPAKG